MRSPVFILGTPRSGTTLLRLMLNNHPNIVIPPECGFAVWWYGKYGHWGAGSAADPGMLSGFIRDLMTSRKIETWSLDHARLREFIAEERPGTYSDLVSCVYRFFGRSTGRVFKRWGDKNNFHVDYVTTLSSLFPECRFVHIVRDGRDVACSYRAVMRAPIVSVYRPRLPTDIQAIAAEWRAILQKVSDALEGSRKDLAYEVRYEDLVSRPESELRRLCGFLGEAYDPGMLEYHVANMVNRLEPPEFLQWKAKTLEKPTDSEVGKFERELRPDEIEAFNREAGDFLRRYGYLEP